jgi:hypothetical protein
VLAEETLDGNGECEAVRSEMNPPAQATPASTGPWTTATKRLVASQNHIPR